MKKGNDGGCWIGFDLGGTKMLAAVFDDKFNILARNSVKTKAHKGVRDGVGRMKELVRLVLSNAKKDKKQLNGIGLGCPGPLDLNKGVLVELPNMGWKNVHIKSMLQDEFGCPVVVLNDVDAGVYGEYRFGAGVGARCLLGVFPGTGVGGGCVYEGKIFRGKNNSAMEIGHMQVLPDGPLCGCGRRGCLETIAGRLAITSQCIIAAHRGQAPFLLKEAGMDLAQIRSSTLAQSLKAGDKAVEKIIRDAAHWLGVAVGNAVNLLLPDVIVLGGGLVEAMPDLFKEEVLKAANNRVMPAFEGSFEVKTAKLGDDAGATGAAAWARDFAENSGK